MSRHTEILPVEIIPRQCFKRFTLVRLVISLLRFRQLVRLVIGFAVEFLNFFFKVRAVIAIGVRQRPRLALVIPVVGIESLSLFEMRNRVSAFTLLEQKLAKSEFGIGRQPVVINRFEPGL